MPSLVNFSTICSVWSYFHQDGLSFQDFLTADTIEEVIMGLSSQISEKEDNIFCSDVRNQLVGPMEFSRRDLAALNIMRGEKVFKMFGFMLRVHLSGTGCAL